MHTWLKWSPLILEISVLIQVFSIGLGASWEQATYLFRRPRLLWNAILARNLVMPLVAVVLIWAFSFHRAIAITLGILAVTPVPPLLPKSQVKSGSPSDYGLGLLVSQAILAIIIVPLSIELMNLVLGSELRFRPLQVAILTSKTILFPLAAGMLAFRYLEPMKKLALPLLAIGRAMLIAGSLVLLLLAWKTFGTLAGNGAILALAIFVAAGLAVGHLMGGPVAANRTTLAIATPSRHPGLAIAIGAANFPEQKMLIAGAVVIYLLVRVVLSAPYTRWRQSVPGTLPARDPSLIQPGLAGRQPRPRRL